MSTGTLESIVHEARQNAMTGGLTSIRRLSVRVGPDCDLTGDEAELNNADSREASALAAKRGRQPRRGSTAQVVADQQQYWGDNKSGQDEDPDEDEDPDMTPPSN